MTHNLAAGKRDGQLSLQRATIVICKIWRFLEVSSGGHAHCTAKRKIEVQGQLSGLNFASAMDE
jgi:hypothetical protein